MAIRHFALACAVAALSLAFVSCASSRLSPSAATDRLEPYSCGSVKRIHTLGGVFLASQPSADDLRHAREGGIRTVVNLRKDGELDWDEAAVVADLGMEYHSVPFRAPSELGDAQLDQLRALLNDSSKRPLLLHCASANRVGAVWLAHRVLDGGLELEAARTEAKTVGLKLPAYAERVEEYIASKQPAAKP